MSAIGRLNFLPSLLKGSPTVPDSIVVLIADCNRVKQSTEDDGRNLLAEDLDSEFARLAQLAGFGEGGIVSCVEEGRRELWVRLRHEVRGESWVCISSLPGLENAFQIGCIQVEGLVNPIEVVQRYISHKDWPRLLAGISKILTYSDSKRDEELSAEGIAEFAKLPVEDIKVNIDTQGKTLSKIWFGVELTADDEDQPTHIEIRMSRVYGAGDQFKPDCVNYLWEM